MVELVKFRVKNYKSIIDSGDCYLDPRITILAGKNEAGKTSILEALADINIDKQIRPEAIRIQDPNQKPEVSLVLRLNKEDIGLIRTELGIPETDIEGVEFTIVKKYSNAYEISIDNLFQKEKDKLSKRINEILPTIKDKVSNVPINDDYTTNNQKPNLESYNPQFKEGVSENEQGQVSKLVEELKSCVASLNPIKTFESGFNEFAKKNLLPNFVMFETFEDVLPSSIPIDQAESKPIIKDLARIANLDFNALRSNARAEEREKHRELVNIKFSEEYSQFWTQDDATLFISSESNNLFIWMKEGGEYYPPERRSKGRQWHLSFYIRVTARSLDGKKNVLLIDEPGLFLHAQAQRDILKRLESCSEKHNIIYTTHSPYLIEREKLSRIRLILKEEAGTKIEKITAKADKETLTPILTAIGEDLSTGIRVDKKNSIVVEGYSDYLWILSFKKLLNIQEELNIVPAVGADATPHVGSILFGWGLDPIFLLDNDKKGKDISKILKDRLAIDENRIIHIPTSAGTIEDLFSEKDRKIHADYENSKESKTLLATKFYNKIENYEIKSSDIEKETLDNFKALFDKLLEAV